jgi:hypothetical protein
VGAIIAALRPGDHRGLDVIADRWGRPAKEVAGILLEEAIRRETRPSGLTDQTNEPQAEPASGPDGRPAA